MTESNNVWVLKSSQTWPLTVAVVGYSLLAAHLYTQQREGVASEYTDGEGEYSETFALSQDSQEKELMEHWEILQKFAARFLEESVDLDPRAAEYMYRNMRDLI